MSDTSSTSVAATKPWSGSTDGSSAPPNKFSWGKLLPFVGPVALFIIWDLVVRAGLIKVILLPTPSATLYALVTGLAGGPLLMDFIVTVIRTLEAFLIAAVVGVPLGVLLGSNERAYRSVEFLIACPTSTRSRSQPSVLC
jgi:ABC-type nitrate/sulfonate/bicarbonate transport system permease component